MQNRIDQIRPDAPLLAGRGDHPVGVQTLQFVNPGQPDPLGAFGATEDRALTVEFWYPVAGGPGCATYDTLIRDGHRRATLLGSASRDLPALLGDFPLVILSHGYPGNRHLLAHFGEHLASHGYRVASIDHLHSTYGDPAFLARRAFPATLLHRPLDVAFVAACLGGDFAVIGYSMGGYGALVLGGAGIAEAAFEVENTPAPALWQRYRTPEPPARLQAIVPIGPWGRQRGLWDAAGLQRMRLPCLVVGGSDDTVSGYEDGIRRIWSELGGKAWLLTFDGAGHNAGAPIPAPAEAWDQSPHLPWPPFEHYADPVWDSVRMNDIARHFVRAFLDMVLKGDTAKADYLAPGWKGFAGGAAPGLRLEERG